MEEFESHIRRAQSLEVNQDITQSIKEYQAADVLYHGEFLEEDRYEDWVQPRRQSVQNSYLYLLDHWSCSCYEQLHFDDCINLCNKVLAADPCREEGACAPDAVLLPPGLPLPRHPPISGLRREAKIRIGCRPLAKHDRTLQCHSAWKM